MSTIEELEAEVERLNSELHAAKRSLFDAKAAAHHIQPGDIIQNSKGAVFKVVRLANSWGSPEPQAVTKKKNGEWGARERALYSWSLAGAKKIGREPPVSSGKLREPSNPEKKI